MPSIPYKTLCITLAAVCLVFIIYASDLIPSSYAKRIDTGMATTLKHLKVAPKEAHTATVIFLHVCDRPLPKSRLLTVLGLRR